jgi:hypothetical protein
MRTGSSEKLIGSGKKCQGTTSVVPKMQQNEPGLKPLRERTLKRAHYWGELRKTTADPSTPLKYASLRMTGRI